MDLVLQLFTGGCITPAQLDIDAIKGRLIKILENTKITGLLIGWNKDADLSEITQLIKDNGAEVHLWLPVFSELGELADFPPLIGNDRKKLEIDFDMGNGETFEFYCPTSAVEQIIDIYEKYYDNEVYDGVFLDKIRYPSFIGGESTLYRCFCDVCGSGNDLPDFGKFLELDSVNPLGISGYEDLRYKLDSRFNKLFDYKCDVIYHSLEKLCAYFRGRDLKIGLDLFAPFMSYFVGQDYYKLLRLCDYVKPMLYGVTNAPAGIPFEIDMYAKTFDDSRENAQKRKKQLMDSVGFGDSFIGNEIAGINKVIKSTAPHTKLYAGIELNYIEHIAPVTEDYIRASITKISQADGIVASWDLNTIPDSHIDCLLDAL